MSCPNYLYDSVFPIYIEFGNPYNLSTNERIYYAICKNCKDTTITDMIMYDMVSKRTVQSIREHLKKLGLIEMVNLNAEEAKEFVIEHSHKGLVCEWCGKQSYILQKHHFPILAKDGGTDIVNICPNCHFAYHKVLGEDSE